MEINFAFRDERINVFAMTYGGVPSKYTHQFMLCKKDILPENRLGPYILVTKRSNPKYELSLTGINYLQYINQKDFDLSFAAFVDCQVKVKVYIELFELLSNAGFFSIWQPEEPYKYYKDRQDGYIVIFKVYRLENSVPDVLIEKGRRGRNFYWHLSQPVWVNAKEPVIEDDLFNSMKTGLIDNIRSGGWLDNVEETIYDMH